MSQLEGKYAVKDNAKYILYQDVKCDTFVDITATLKRLLCWLNIYNAI